MAISYTYPRVDVNTTALTRRILTETIDDTIVMLSIFNSKCGPIDTINRIHGISQFESIYGSIDDDTLGNTGLNIRNWLSNGGTVYAMRHIPSQDLANSYYGSENVTVNKGLSAYSEISDEIHGTIRNAIIFRNHKYCSDYNNIISNSVFSSNSGLNVSIGMYILNYRNDSTNESRRKYFPVYFIYDDGNPENSLLNSIPYNLYSPASSDNNNTITVAVPLPENYEGLDDSTNFLNTNFKILKKGDVYRKWYKDENDNYSIESPISDINSLKEYFENYFSANPSFKLSLDHIELPVWLAVTTDTNGDDRSTDDISYFTFEVTIEGKARRLRISNSAFEIDSDDIDIVGNTVWSLIDGSDTDLPLIYDKELLTKDAIKNILVGSAAAVQNTKDEILRRFILEDYRVDDYIISLEAVSLCKKYGDADTNYRSSLKESKSLYTLENSSSPSSNVDFLNQSKFASIANVTSKYSSIEKVDDGVENSFNVNAFFNRIPLIYNPRVVSKNPGSLYNNLKLSFYRKSSTSSVYKLFLGGTLIESLEISGYYDLIGIDNAVSDQIYIDMDFDINNDMWHTYFEHMSLLINASGDMIYNYYNPSGYTINITKADVESLYANKLTTINNPLTSGSLISLSFYNGTDTSVSKKIAFINLDKSLQSLTVYSALKTEKTRKLLMNTLEFPIDIFFDAGYSAKTKKAIYEAFCSEPTSNDFIRSDVNVILDSFFIDDRTVNPTRAIRSATEDSVDGGLLIDAYLPKTSNTKNLSIYEQYFKIALNNTLIVVSPTYFLSKNIAYYDISLGYGTHAPIAGMKRGLIENYKYINKQYLPDSAQELFGSDVNYATVYRNGTAFMSQRTREDDSQNTALQFFNNSFTTNRIVKELERIARAYLFEYNDAVSISNLRKTLNQYIGRYVSDRVLTYAMLDVQRDIYNSELINIVLNIKFNNSVEVIEVNLVIE